jgi:hypothetical protein
MTSRLEDLLREAMHAGPLPEVSPDLFARVSESIEADRARRRKAWRVALAWISGLAVAGSIIGVVTPRDERGLQMPWWVMEIGQTLVLVAIAVWLGPFIKRFGRAYAADVFRDNPMTGKSYIVLTDIVYYLIFTAYILLTLSFEPREWWGLQANAVQLQDSVAEIAGILLVIGILHGLNILILPVLGRLFQLNRQLRERSDSR